MKIRLKNKLMICFICLILGSAFLFYAYPREDLTVFMIVPEGVYSYQNFKVIAEITAKEDLYNVNVSLMLPYDAYLVSGNTTITIDSLDKGVPREVVWFVWLNNDTPGITYFFSVNITNNQIDYLKKSNTSSLLISDDVLDQLLWDSIVRYERYVSSNEDSEYGYVSEAGYPMYLQFITDMYFEMYRQTNESYYLSKAIRGLGYIYETKNSDWTWCSTNGRKSPLYSGTSIQLFMKAYEFSGNQTYLTWANNTITGLAKLQNNESGAFNCVDQRCDSIILKTKNYEKPSCGKTNVANGDIYPVLYLGKYMQVTGSRDYLDMAQKAYYSAKKCYDQNTGQWHYRCDTKDKFNSHNAFYALGIFQWLYENKEYISTVDPQVWEDVKKISQQGITAIEPFINDDGTFDYEHGAPECVECAATTVFALSMYDKLFQSNHSELITKAKKTILSNQVAGGAYYKTVGENVTEFWYGDNIGRYLTSYLNWMTADVKDS